MSVYALNQFHPIFFTTLSEIRFEIWFCYNHGCRYECGCKPDFRLLEPRKTLSLKVLFQPLQTVQIYIWLQPNWCIAINPTVKQYSFYSDGHKTYSHIDYILTSSSISEIHNAVLSPYPLSNHSIILVKLTLLNTPTRAARWLLNTTLLKSKDYCVYLQRQLSRFVAKNTSSVNDPRIFW